MAKDKKSKAAGGDLPEVEPEVVDHVIKKAQDEGVSPETAKEILREALEEGADPENLQEVAEEAVEVEREDQEQSR